MAITIMRGGKSKKIAKVAKPVKTEKDLSSYEPLATLKKKDISLFHKLNMLMRSVIASQNHVEEGKMLRYMNGILMPSDFDGLEKDLKRLKDLFTEYTVTGDSDDLLGVLKVTELAKV